MKYKTDFPVIINLPQCFTATISAKLGCHVVLGVSHNILWALEAPCVLWPWIFLQAMWCPKMFWNLSIIYYKVETEHREEIRWRFRYSLGVKRWKCRSVKVVKRWFQHWFDSWLHQLHIIFCQQAGGDQKFWFVFHCEGKILLTLFGDHIFPYGDWKKISVASWRLLKKVNFVPCLSPFINTCPQRCQTSFVP